MAKMVGHPALIFISFHFWSDLKKISLLQYTYIEFAANITIVVTVDFSYLYGTSRLLE
jgi:hypothetical protein